MDRNSNTFRSFSDDYLQYLQEYAMVEDTRTILSDAEFTQLVYNIRRELPYCGEVMFIERLGFFVTRARLRQVIREIDVINTALQWGGNIPAR